MRIKTFKSKKISAFLLGILLIIIGTICVLFKINSNNKMEKIAVAIDGDGYLKEEEFSLEATRSSNELYEIELPESINSKKTNEFVKVELIDETSKKELEIKDNKIQLTKEEFESKDNQISFEVKYDVAILEKTKEEKEVLYNKILKYENKEKKVELKSYLPEGAQIQVEEVSKTKLKEIFGDKKIAVAYDIKILENEEKVNPKDFGEICEVVIKDKKISPNAKVYHVKEDNSYEEISTKGNEKGNIKFETQTFSIFAIDDSQTMLLGANATNPYIPTGYTQVAGTSLDTGFTVQDSLGNQYVWVEVPRTTEVYPTAGLAITEFTDSNYTKIENDLHTYTSVYRNGTTFTDTYSSEDITGLTETQYYEQKRNMLKSIYQYEGFYVGKYETGIDYSEGPKTSGSSTVAPTETPVIKRSVYPYNYVTSKQAQTLASGFASQLDGYTSSLMFGVQWDLILKYLETKRATQAELNEDSTSWGNYYNNNWTISNENSKYSANGTSWISGAYGKKTSSKSVLLSTGASDTFCKQGIYDLAGNFREWTLEKTSNSVTRCASRGGDYSLSRRLPNCELSR